MEKKFARNSWWLILASFTVIVAAARVGAFLLRFDFSLPPEQWRHLWMALSIDLPVKIGVLYVFRVHRGWSSPVGLPDLKRIAGTCVVAALAVTSIIYVSQPRFPRSVYIIDLLLVFLLVSGLRVSVWLLFESRRQKRRAKNVQNVLVYGAGRTAAALLRELGANPHLPLRAVGLIDDDPLKQKETLLGARILGTGQDLPKVIASLRRRNICVEQILIAMPSASGKQMRQAVLNCRNAGLICKTLPGMSDLLTTRGLSTQIRDVALEDLLGRDPVELDEGEIRKMIQGVSVLVTGAAGSIGSELCRQVAAYRPSRLVVLDQAESPLFQVEMELRKRFPTLAIAVELADIRSFDRVEQVVRTHNVEAIFHAAAYKHVPMMETHAVEGAVNNVLGTANLGRVAVEQSVKSFVMISSDKAVNPTNVMGATKRAAELVVASLADTGDTRFVSVRFGNVLGSNGSVVPIFQSQIASGGPVTVTHPEVRRYFMTVREAVQLVLQASTMGEGNEVFVLDMGEPVRIVDLARNLVRLAGLVPDRDIQITFTGLRPGEKLYEELITEGENILPTYHKKIKIFRSEPPNRQAMETWLDELRLLADRNDGAGIVAHLSDLIPEYEVSAQWSAGLRVRSRRLPVVGAASAAKAFRTAI